MDKTIETKRVHLKLLTEKDFDDMLAMMMDPETSHFIKHLHLRQREEYLAILHNRLDQIKSETGFHWVGRLKTTGELVGAINVSLIAGTRRMQLGFQLNKRFWNQGLAFEMADPILKFAVDIKGIAPIFGVFDQENLASKKVLEKLGFLEVTEPFLEEKNIVTYRYPRMGSV